MNRPLLNLALAALLLAPALARAQNSVSAVSASESDSLFDGHWAGNLVTFNLDLNIVTGGYVRAYDDVVILSFYNPKTKQVIRPGKGYASGLILEFDAPFSPCKRPLSLTWASAAILSLAITCCEDNKFPVGSWYCKYQHIPVGSVTEGNASSVAASPVLFFSMVTDGPAPVKW